MFLSGRFAAATASLLLAGALFLPSTTETKAAGATAISSDTAELAVVRADEPPRPHGTSGTVWPLRNSWNRATEDLYSAWIEKLFDAPLDAEPSWKAWHEVLRDKSRNLLFNYLGTGEDNVTMNLRPDC